MAMLAIGAGADVALDQFKTRQIERFEHTHRLSGHFRSDPVPSENSNFHRQNTNSLFTCNPCQPLAQHGTSRHNIAAVFGKRVALELAPKQIERA